MRSIVILLIMVIVSCNNKQEKTDINQIDSVFTTNTYKTNKLQKRKWNRELYYSDFDSITISRWKTLTKEEKIKIVEESFNFNINSNVWNNYSTKEKYHILFDNTYIEFE